MTRLGSKLVFLFLVVFTLSACGSGGADTNDSSIDDTPVVVVSDTTPNNFTFSSITNVEIANQVTSESVIISGIDSDTTVSITAGAYSINDGDFVSEQGLISNGDEIAVQLTSADTFDTQTSLTLTIGGVSAEFVVTTITQPVAVDTSPDTFEFSSQTDRALEEVVTSNTITVSGVNSNTAISIEGGLYNINGGDFTSSESTVSNGDTVQIQLTASSEFDTTTTTTLTIGDVSASFSVTTLSADTAPEAFAFTSQTDRALEEVVTSNTITVSGVNSNTSISIEGGLYNINGGDFTSSESTVINGDTVQIQLTASSEFDTTTTATLTIGDTSTSFSVTTLSEDTTPEALSFTTQEDLETNTTVTSNVIIISGINTTAALSITDGEYSINGGDFTLADGTINNGDSLQLRMTTSSEFDTSTSTTIILGSESSTFSATTREQLFYVTRWQTDNEGGTGDNQIVLRLNPAFEYDFTVDWGDGSVDENVINDTLHTYDTAGIYTVTISGTYPAPYFPEITDTTSTDSLKLLSVEQWGDASFSSMEQAFYNADNLVFNDTLAPNLSSGSSTRLMLAFADGFDSPIDHWDVSNVTDMTDMLVGTSFSIANYDALLTTWSTLSLQANVQLDVDSHFSASVQAARDTITSSFDWTINDFGVLSSPELQAQTDTINVFDTVSSTIMIAGNGQPLDSCTATGLPAGLSIQVSGSNCVIIGTPTDTLTATTIEVTATNAAGASTVSIVIESGVQLPYITTWQTDNSGMSDDNQITLQLNPDLAYDFTVDWGDSNTDENVTADITHTYASAGEYTVTITGTYPAPYFPATTSTSRADSLKLVSVEQWGNAPFSSMAQAFYNADNVVFNDTLAPVFTGGVSMNNMFRSNGSFNSDISFWDVANVTNMSYMFSSASTFNQNIGEWDVANVTNMSDMFENAEAFNQNIGEWDVANVTNMADMFENAEAFNQNIGEWDVANVTDMSSMFSNASAFNQDIGQWNTSNVTDMSSMFEDVSDFNQNIGEWDVSNVTDMSSMFQGVIAFNQDIGEWDVANVTDMSEMFRNASDFNQDIGDWDVSNVKDMGYMLYFASTFSQDIGEWDVANVTDMSRMFSNASAFNQDIGDWDVANVTDMSDMFNGASAFNQDIGEWDVSNVTYMIRMFNTSGISVSNYDALLIGWSTLSILQEGVELDVDSNFSSAAQSARDVLTTPVADGGFGWTINDEGLQ
jgi:surface protein